MKTQRRTSAGARKPKFQTAMTALLLNGLKCVSSAVMVLDRSFRITYVNEAARQLLLKNAEHFRTLWPGFDPDEVIGLCVDQLHKDSARQSNNLATPENLTRRTTIQVGALNFELNVHALLDPKARQVGHMLEWRDVTQWREQQATLAAIGKAQAVIEFALDGTILSANERFLSRSGYTLEEIKGKPHSMFIQSSDRDSSDERALWDKLRRGEFDAGQYKRIVKSGQQVWVQASYHPIFDANGAPFKVVELASNITEGKMRTADYEGQIAAISKAQAVIEFELDGTIRAANDNFLKTFGYTFEEIKGKHHSLLVEPTLRESPEYRAFCAKLGRGEYDAAQYKCLRKGGGEVWIQASYNPILNANGNPFKVVEYATDVTQNVLMSEQLQTAVRETQATVSAAIDGDLISRIPTEGKSGEIEALCSGVNSLLDVMTDLVRRAKAAAGAVQASAEEISKGNSHLSQRTEEQASNLAETASSMEEMTSTVKQTADNASQADQLAMAARQQAEKGGAVVGMAVQAMGGINSASKRIADIIGVIDEIAFQTNLLALNAAVEAARAGEQGRGFAVVATEVRNLAGRSAVAAKEIKSLIQDSVTKVSDGTKLVDQSGAMLGEIVRSFKKVTDIVTEIASASREQSSGIEQVNTAVMQMEKRTQQNAALVEEAAAASQSIVEQAQALTAMIARYNIDEERAGNAATRAERRTANRPWHKVLDKPTDNSAGASIVQARHKG